MNEKIKSIKLYSSPSLGRCARDCSSTRPSLAEIKILSIISLIITIFSFSTPASASPEAASYKINGKQESARFNPSVADSKVSIEISANVPVKFNTIAFCSAGDAVCSRTTAVKYFTQTADFSLSVSKDWDGKTSKGTAVSDGDYKIKVTMKDESGAENTQELSPYIITTDSNFSGSSGGNSSESSSFDSQNSSNQPSSSSSDASSPVISSFISTHSSPEDLSASSKSSPARFEAGSGRDRLAYSGAPIVFDGKVSANKDSYGQSARFVWSFGDGSVAEGEKVSHTYKFAGDYIVVLNASLFDLSAVSRTSVKVVNPSVAISNVSVDSVEVWNKGIYEINLNGWLLSNDRGKFIFPTDTIIGPNKKIAFPDEYVKLILSQGGKISLLNPSQKEISVFADITERSSSSPALVANLSDLDNDPIVKKIREFIAKGSRSSADNNPDPISKNNLSAQVGEASVGPDEKSIAENQKDAVYENEKIISSSAQTASAESNQVPSHGFMRSLINLPYSGLDFIKRMFYSGN